MVHIGNNKMGQLFARVLLLGLKKKFGVLDTSYLNVRHDREVRQFQVV